MGSSPYSPVIPLVICLPLRPLTGALMPARSGEAFRWRIGLLNKHPPFLTSSTSVVHSEKPHAVLCNAIHDLTETLKPVKSN